jgi:membrane protease YdiL (CAAX protease family)
LNDAGLAITRQQLELARAQLTLVGIASLGLVRITDWFALTLANRFLPALYWIGVAHVTSMLVCTALYLAVRPAQAFATPDPRTNWRGLFRDSLILLGATALAVTSGIFTPEVSPVAVVGMLGFGLLAEETLFRGVIFELAERAVPRWPNAPLIISTVLFSLQHLSYHNYHLTHAAMIQIAYTLPMGWVLGRLRQWSKSLLPSIILHFLINSMALLLAYFVR